MPRAILGGMRDSSWLDRALGHDHDEERPRAQTPGAIGCALVAVALAVAAELSPWASVTGSAGNLPPNVDPDEIGAAGTLYLATVGTWTSLVYAIGWMGLFALTATAIATRSKTAAAAGVGWAAGQAVLIAGVVGAINRGETLSGRAPTGAEFGMELGPFAAFAGVVVAVAAVVFAMWTPARRTRTHNEAVDVEPGPVDLTVTSVSPVTTAPAER